MRNNIMPNDTVLHKPSKETWVVAGVNFETRQIVPSGYPFPSIASLDDCELVERGYELERQSEHVINEFQRRGMLGFIDVRSAMFRGII